MRINLDRFSFETPPGFTDNTNYTFSNSKTIEYLSVSYGAPETNDLRSLLAMSRANLDILAPDTVKMEDETDTRMDGIPARMLSFTFEDRGVAYHGFWAVALPMPQTYVQISFVALARDARAAAKFQHVLRSVVPARRTPPASSPGGYVRRWAHLMTLDVPALFQPPNEFDFASSDGTISLSLSYFDPLDTPSRRLSAEEEMAKETRLGRVISDQTVRGISISAGHAATTAYLLSTQKLTGETQEALRRADVTLGTAASARLVLRAPAASAAQLDGILERFLESIRLTE